MKTLSEVTRDEFRGVLTDANVLTLRVIHIAIAAGVLLFCGVVLFLYVSMASEVRTVGEDEFQLIQLASFAHLVVAFTAYAAANFLFNIQFKEDKLSVQSETPAEQCLTMIRSALILRIALYEAPALFGIVVCLLAIMNGVLYVQPLVALNLITTLILLGLVVNTMPSKERLETLFVAHIHS